MGQVEMQRGYGDVIVSRGLQIGSVIRCMDSAAKPKPVIRKAARVSALYYAGATIVMEARSEEHTSELQSLMRISYAVFCLKKKNKKKKTKVLQLNNNDSQQQQYQV